MPKKQKRGVNVHCPVEQPQCHGVLTVVVNRFKHVDEIFQVGGTCDHQYVDLNNEQKDVVIARAAERVEEAE